ncbi:hypothetical protein BCR41DRAFT_31841 [Lobosporangium transversale]|uniref:Uncharacterized protein n=1 Tax=Lobosporangium transversale TaxID=64571 RepID=A0A1Y2FYR8_9FUNG|nr:hypothetical protein BCR41DRAFT_31841 [Lobosporangium transversale]ORY88695.1 hypothetical protein BCR41DRAFT_31841 [Lobosporangium transversale]|eukprot:XP_021875007.1 hypothetical protein BCR41DRAFT_31841 [Lobosporangium transversale]
MTLIHIITFFTCCLSSFSTLSLSLSFFFFFFFFLDPPALFFQFTPLHHLFFSVHTPHSLIFFLFHFVPPHDLSFTTHPSAVMFFLLVHHKLIFL